MKIASIARALPLGNNTKSPQSQKSKEAMTAYSAKFNEFTRDVRKFVRLLEDAKKATMKNEACYQQIIAQTSVWTSNLNSETMNQEEIAAIELSLREYMLDYDSQSEEEVVKEARKFKVAMVNELRKTLKSGREAWSGVHHYESKVKGLNKKLDRMNGSGRPQENIEDKLERNEKKLLQSITIASQWDQELKRCSGRVDQAWITVIRIIKTFTEFEKRTSGDMMKLKSKIDELMEEDAAYAQDQKVAQPLSIVGEEAEESFPMKGTHISTISSGVSTASTELQSFISSFKKKNKKASSDDELEKSFASHPENPAEEYEDEVPEPNYDRIVDYDQSADSYFSKAESKQEEVSVYSKAESKHEQLSVYSKAESKQEPAFDVSDSDQECYISEPQEDEITV